MKEYWANHAKNLIIAHIYINSIANKLEDIKPILSENYADILVVGETKIDDTFPQSQFQLPNYKTFRKDRNCHGGGLMVFIKNDLACHRWSDLE